MTQPEQMLKEIGQCVEPDADRYIHADVMARLTFLLKCEEALQEVAEYQCMDPEGYLPGYVDDLLGELNNVREILDDIKQLSASRSLSTTPEEHCRTLFRIHRLASGLSPDTNAPKAK